MIQSQRNKYLETTVQTASPAQLLIMLCDGAIRYSKMGIEALKNHQHQEANQHLIRVQDIISEFSITLDRSSPIADNLLKLYEYFTHRLIEANIKKDPAPVEEILGFLTELKETWIQAAKLVNSGASSSHAGATHG